MTYPRLNPPLKELLTACLAWAAAALVGVALTGA